MRDGCRYSWVLMLDFVIWTDGRVLCLAGSLCVALECRAQLAFRVLYTDGTVSELSFRVSARRYVFNRHA